MMDGKKPCKKSNLDQVDPTQLGQSNMTQQEALISMAIRLDALLAAGKEDTEEYEKLSEEYQALALDSVEDDIFGDI